MWQANVSCLCFKQKTAYEMRISDWRSDVRSSDLDGQATAMMPSGSKQDLSGRTLSFAPKVTASLTPTVTLPLGRYLLQTAVYWLYQGDQYTDIDLDPHTFEPAHSTYSARIDRKSTRLNSSQ